jgi:hypothetical protein
MILAGENTSQGFLDMPGVNIDAGLTSHFFSAGSPGVEGQAVTEADQDLPAMKSGWLVFGNPSPGRV